jgi:peroxiredoxin
MYCGNCLGVFVAFILLVQLVLGVNGSASAADSRSALAYSSAAQGKAAPDFVLPDLDGKSVRLSSFKGERPVLLYFWATWCPYCVQAKPKLAKLREAHGEKAFEILGINVGTGDSVEKLKRFQLGHPVSWPILYDKDGMISKSFQVEGIPLFILVSKDGLMVFRDHQPPQSKDLTQYLQ